jgi:prepilin peptidase CpaA
MPSTRLDMLNSPVSAALLIGLAAALVVAAVIDIRTFKISNRFNIGVALAAPLFWWSSGLSLWPGVGIQLIGAALVFALLMGAFMIGMMGGGDVKLAAALALWFPPLGTLHFLMWMSLAGGLLTLGLLVAHRLRQRPGRPGIPYGVAISSGAWVVLAQRFLNHFA